MVSRLSALRAIDSDLGLTEAPKNIIRRGGSAAVSFLFVVVGFDFFFVFPCPFFFVHMYRILELIIINIHFAKKHAVVVKMEAN